MSKAIPSLMETNVYAVKGRVLITGACLPQVWPEAFEQLASDADQVYSLCLEATHINMAITKLSAIFGTGQLLNRAGAFDISQNNSFSRFDGHGRGQFCTITAP